MCLQEQAEFQQKTAQTGKVAFVKSERKTGDNLLNRMLVEGQVWKYRKANGNCDLCAHGGIIHQ